MRKKHELSFLNVWFCILVVLIHVLAAPLTQTEKGSVWYALVFFPWRISAFVVQGFIFLAGVKLALGFEKKVKYINYIKSRFSGIIVPYVIWVLVYYAYFISRNYFEFSVKDLVVYVLKGNLVAHFYFVIIIVQFYVMKPLWKIMTQKIRFRYAVLISLSVMLLSKLYLPAVFGEYTDRIFPAYLLFWVCGCYFGANYENFKHKILKSTKAVTVMFFASLLCEMVFGYIHFTVKYIAGIELLHLVYCVFSILFFTAVSFCVGDRMMKYRLIRDMDSAGYYIYLVHPLFIFVVNEKMAQAGLDSVGITFAIRTVAVYMGAILSSIIYMKIKKELKVIDTKSRLRKS